MKTFWVTFYSYKGGVGRSLCLANVAALLAQQGRRVVLIDFDLEAPGLDSFPEFDSIRSKPGVVEYTDDFLTTKRMPEVSKYVHRCPFDKSGEGEIWLMPSGDKGSSSYNRQREQLNWEKMYSDGIGEPFVNHWKGAIEDYCNPDFVFIDSRTGLTDVGGICTLHFPDLVVLLFSLNEQNLNGTHAVMETIRKSDDQVQPQIMLVATPVPNFREPHDLLSERLKKARELFGTEITHQVHYSPRAALEEKMTVLEDSANHSITTHDYTKIRNAIRRRNEVGIDQALKQAQELEDSFDLEQIRQQREVLRENYSDRSEALVEIARLSRPLDELDAYESALRDAVDRNPGNFKAFNLLRNFLRDSGRHKEFVELSKRVAENETLSFESKSTIYDSMAASAMKIGDFESAIQGYEADLESEADDVIGLTGRLAGQFNLAEAKRRATREISTDQNWEEIATLFTRVFSSGPSELYSDLASQANHSQASHVAFAATGNVLMAETSLQRAIHLAESLTENVRVFDLALYAEIPVSEFIQSCSLMRESLGEGKLWDGTLLPPKLD